MERTALAGLLLPLLLALAAAPARGQGFVADTCKMKDGSAGVCRSISNCPEARAALLKGETPVVCSYDGFTPIVCCPAGASGLAARMCTKYGEAVYRYEKTFHIPPQLAKVDQCAMKGVPFIHGGEEAVPNEFPHMALMGYGDARSPAWNCGGSLISKRFVMTAAHCIITPQGEPRVVRLGELSIRAEKETNVHEDFRVERSTTHPNYKDGVLYDDVGLVKLDRDVVFTASIRPVCLQAVAEIPDQEAIASGWGFTDWDVPEITDHLMKVRLPIQKTEACQNAYKTLATTFRLSKGILGESMVCAGTLQGGKDTCRGDSGGPLQIKLKTPYCMYSVVGITSFGKGNCGTSKAPAIYTRVSHFLPWIESIAWVGEK